MPPSSGPTGVPRTPDSPLPPDCYPSLGKRRLAGAVPGYPPCSSNLHIGSPVVRVIAGLLPHLPAVIVFAPSRTSPVPQVCLHLPAAYLLVAGAAGPVAPALILIDDIARRTQCDVMLVSPREPNHPQAIRFEEA